MTGLGIMAAFNERVEARGKRQEARTSTNLRSRWGKHTNGCKRAELDLANRTPLQKCTDQYIGLFRISALGVSVVMGGAGSIEKLPASAFGIKNFASESGFGLETSGSLVLTRYYTNVLAHQKKRLKCYEDAIDSGTRCFFFLFFSFSLPSCSSPSISASKSAAEGRRLRFSFTVGAATSAGATNTSARSARRLAVVSACCW